MADRYVKELLQSEIMAALALAPASTHITNRKTGAMLGKVESVDPALFPLAIVEMPEEISSQSLSENMCRSEYEVLIHIFASQEDSAEADLDFTLYTNVIRKSLCAYNSMNMRRLGWHPNNVQVNDEGWFARGQDPAFRIRCVYPLFVPTTQIIDDD